jgi:hypothetical protein
MIDLRPAAGPRLALQLSARDEGLSVHVVESPVGEAAADIVLQPIDDVLRMVSQPTFHEDVGRGLFRSLFPGPLRELYRAAFSQATLAGERLTVELRFDRDLARVARYPWEFLHDGTRFLLQAGAVNLVRYLTFPEPPRPLAPCDPLEILVVSARPKDQPPLASEFEQLRQAFQPLIAQDKLDLAYLLPPTWNTLMDWLLAGAPSVLHFEGYGAFTRTGLLIFENTDGESDPVEAATLGNAFYGTDLRLAVLSACDTAKAGGESLLGSVAPALILAGIPAVVAMQRRLPDEAAVRFSRGFYDALLGGQDLESAVMAGRRQLVRTMYWHVPALYLRASKTPTIKQAYLERRIDTAGPHAAPVDLPLRFGLWVRRPDSPQPCDDELRRLLGLEREDAITREATRAAMPFPVELAQIQPGALEVRISAPGCDLHTSAVKSLTVFTDFDTPPLWFPMTPRQVGRLDVTFELLQGGAMIASVTHTIQVTAGVENDPVASVQSHGAEPPPPEPTPEPIAQPKPVEDVALHANEEKPAEVAPEPAPDFLRRRESEEQRQDNPASVSAEAAYDEALDGVADLMQSGEPPEDHDEPLGESEMATGESAPLDDWVEYGASHPQKPPPSQAYAPGTAPQSAPDNPVEAEIMQHIDALLGRGPLEAMTAAQSRRSRSPVLILAALLVVVLVVVVVVWLFVI